MQAQTMRKQREFHPANPPLHTAHTHAATHLLQRQKMIASASPQVAQLMKYAAVAATSRVVQRVTEVPAAVIVKIVDGNVTEVRNAADEQPITFALEAHAPATVPEGTALVTGRAKTLAIRFATVDTAIGDLSSLTKVKIQSTEAVSTASSSSSSSAPRASSASSAAPRYALTDSQVKISSATQDPLFRKGMGLTAFEKSGSARDNNLVDQGQIHFDKHGGEFEGIDTKSKYITAARDFANINGHRSQIEVQIKNTRIRYDPAKHLIVIANDKLIRTFYRWDPEFSSDPVAFAIYYTITHNMGLQLSDIDANIVTRLRAAGHDLNAMEQEVAQGGPQAQGGSEDESKEEKKSKDEA